MQALESVFLIVAALLPIVNPLGGAPIFLAMSADLPEEGRRPLAWAIARNTFVLLAAAMLIGSYVLAFFGISLPVVRVAGGLVLLASGWRLLNAQDLDRPPTAVAGAWEREVGRRNFYPLTFPLTVGPGSVSIAIALGASTESRNFTAMTLLTELVGILCIAVAVYFSYRFASKLTAWLGETGTNVFLRLSAFILLCVGISILWSGIAGLIEEDSPD